MSGYFYGIGGLGSSFFDTDAWKQSDRQYQFPQLITGRSENDSEWCL